MKARTLALTLIMMAAVCPGVLAQKCTEKLPSLSPGTNRGVPKIKRKPQPDYTEEARRHNVVGTVVLRGTFHSSGQVQDVCWVQGLPYGLTENAVRAAYKIEFEPITEDGKPVSKRIFIEYNFNLY